MSKKRHVLLQTSPLFLHKHFIVIITISDGGGGSDSIIFPSIPLKIVLIIIIMHSHSAARQIHWIILFACIRWCRRRVRTNERTNEGDEENVCRRCVASCRFAPTVRQSEIVYSRHSRAQTNVMKTSEKNDENE